LSHKLEVAKRRSVVSYCTL